MEVYFLIVLCLWPPGAHSTQWWVHKRFSEISTCRQMGGRLVNLTRSTYHDVGQRITDLNEMRFMYEKTPHYEQGYVFSEIIERYKKMVEHYKKMVSFTSMHTYDLFDRVEHIQKLYFEVYHLVMMMHEIPRKYKGTVEFKDSMMSEADKERERSAKEAFAQAEKQREMAAKLLIMQEHQAKQGKVGGLGGKLLGNQSMHEYNRISSMGLQELGKRFPKRWPKDYGWEPSKWWV